MVNKTSVVPSTRLQESMLKKLNNYRVMARGLGDQLAFVELLNKLEPKTRELVEMGQEWQANPMMRQLDEAAKSVVPIWESRRAKSARLMDSSWALLSTLHEVGYTGRFNAIAGKWKSAIGHIKIGELSAASAKFQGVIDECRLEIARLETSQLQAPVRDESLFTSLKSIAHKKSSRGKKSGKKGSVRP